MNVADQWSSLDRETTYLNHGSFGPTPRRVQAEQRMWQERLLRQPMDFYLRQLEDAWLTARARVAAFAGADADNLVFVENATAAMNVVAHSFPLSAGDEVLLTDHEYGAVHRIWERACRRVGAALRVAVLPWPLESDEQVVQQLFAAVGPRTRLMIVSHITSPTALILPVQAVCAEARQRDIAVCIDGPHALAQIPVELEALGCEFYTASLHKWVSAPFGSGFLYVAPTWQSRIEPPVLSWGRLLPARPACWWHEFIWPGTRDPSAYLATPAAIELLDQVGLDAFRRTTHELAKYARAAITELTSLEAGFPDSTAWYGSMVRLPLPPVDARKLQQQLWEVDRIEVPIMEHAGRCAIRVSCHLYNHRDDIDRLVTALQKRLPR